MRMHTIEDDFEYHAKEILVKLFSEYEDEIREAKAEGTDLNDFLWKNRSALGELFLNNLNEWVDVTEVVGEEWNEIEASEEEKEE